MGDRANVKVLMGNGNDPVFLYTHRGGRDLPEVCRVALAKGWRWNDQSYLARIIFEEMICKSLGRETGYGIATYPPDNDNYPYIVIDCEHQEVRFERLAGLVAQWSFEKYSKQDVASWPLEERHKNLQEGKDWT